jgi:hypothetical protein
LYGAAETTHTHTRINNKLIQGDCHLVETINNGDNGLQDYLFVLISSDGDEFRLWEDEGGESGGEFELVLVD